MLMILSCKQTSQLISQSLDRRLTMRERFALRLHLLICDYCTRFNVLLHRLETAVKKLTATIENDTSITLPAAVKSRIAETIKSLPD